MASAFVRRVRRQCRAGGLGLAVAAVAVCLSAPASAQTGPPQGLDGYIRQVMERFEVPGLAVAIVKDDQVVYAKGFGVRRLGTQDPVDAKTLFGIASNTKLFTATALGILVQDGKIQWDQPVIRYLPDFAMYDSWVTRQMTVRDLLVHRSGLGLGAGDLMFWPPTNFSREELVERLRYIPPATSFRSAYAYDNVLYPVAGEVIARVSGMSWEDFVKSRILEPVGMTGSDVRLHDPASMPDAAFTHARVEGKVQQVPPYHGDAVNPAGGIFANVEDMAKWVMVQMDSGRVAATGARAWEPSVTRQLWAPVNPMPFGDPPPELAPQRHFFNFYALGVNVRDYRGERILTHTGGLPGYVSRVTMVPDRKLGVVVLTNQEAGAAFESITYGILDHYMGADPYDWLEAYSKVQDRNDAALAAFEARQSSERNADSKPSLALDAYAGTYRDAWYGDVELKREGDHLVIRFSRSADLVGDLEHWQYDSFLVKWRDRSLRADAFITFALNPDGSIEHAKMKPASPAVDFSYDFQDLLLKPVR